MNTSKKTQGDNKKRLISSDSSFDDSMATTAEKAKTEKVKPEQKKQRFQVQAEIHAKPSSSGVNVTMSDIHSIESKLESINRKLDNLVSTDDLKSALEASKDSIVSLFAEKIEKLEGRLHDVECENDKLIKEVNCLKKKVDEKEEKLQEAQYNIKLQGQKLNDLEQYTRKESVRIFGVRDDNKFENQEQSMKKATETFAKIGVEITSRDISASHRLGAYNAERPRAIIVKFTSRQHKYDVLRNRRKLKGTGIGISEDLTTINQHILKNTQSHPAVIAAWTRDGTVIAKLLTDKIVRITPDTDLDALVLSPHSTK